MEMHRIHTPRPGHAVALLVIWAAPCGAADVGDATISFNGFGTLGVVRSDYDEADFVTDVYFHDAGAGHSRRWSAAQDTRLGLQVGAAIGERLTAVVQAVSHRRHDDTFEPGLEWANLAFAITPDLTLRAGRIVLPTFMSSDTEHVGYVRTWVRTPAELRVMQPLTNSDGVDATWRFDVGSVQHRVQVLYGNNESTLPGGLPYENRSIRNITDTIEYGRLTGHLSFQQLRYTYANDPETPYRQFDAGVTYDADRWFVAAEILLSHDALVGNTRSWYAGGGYRIADLTPYVLVSHIEQTTVEPGSGEYYNQHTVTAGLRWDFMKNLAAKLQLERVVLDTLDFPSSFVNLQPGARLGDAAHVLSATLDFVW
jgi:hypothetical protein